MLSSYKLMGSHAGKIQARCKERRVIQELKKTAILKLLKVR